VSVKVHVIENLSLLEAIAPAWQVLDEQTFPRLPFTGPHWNLLWWKHFAEKRRTVADRIQSFVVFDGDQLLAVAPMMLTERPAVGPVRARHLQFFGADPNVTEVRGLCCRRYDEGRVLDAILSDLAARARDWDWVELSGFAEHGPAREVIARRTPLIWTRQVPDFLIEPGCDWEVFKQGLPRNLKEAIRKCYTTLRRDNLQYEFRVTERADEMEARLETFFELHSLRAHAPITPNHADVFAPLAARRFLREYLSRVSRLGSARLFELLVEGQVVASRIGFVLGDHLYLYFSGYHPKMSKYSVMTTCKVEAIKWAIRQGIKKINLSTGRDQSKLRWRPMEVSLMEAQWLSPSWRGRVSHRFVHAMKKGMLPDVLGSFTRTIHRDDQ
jgi:CelD/BcsL family acetyltransferase involved in cellulose biosynthesis